MECTYRNTLTDGAVAVQCRTHGHPYPCPHDPDATPATPKPKGPREHIARSAPPWRPVDPAAVRTECGRDVDQARTITREALLERIRGLVDRDGPDGRKAALLNTCKVCRDRASYHPDWKNNPASVLAREADDWADGDTAHWSDEHRRVSAEMFALAELVAADPDRFADLLAAHTTALDTRAAMDRKRAEARRAALLSRAEVWSG
jgi:hypothetical protein